MVLVLIRIYKTQSYFKVAKQSKCIKTALYDTCIRACGQEKRGRGRGGRKEEEAGRGKR
jgi:hypothetical protein